MAIGSQNKIRTEGENDLMSGFIICTLHVILSGKKGKAIPIIGREVT
jgi:hypothetical protein